MYGVLSWRRNVWRSLYRRGSSTSHHHLRFEIGDTKWTETSRSRWEGRVGGWLRGSEERV